MANIQNIEVAVKVDISNALGKLTKLQDELQDLAAKIEQVDARGAEGIDIRTNLDSLDNELAAAKTKIEAFEASESLDIPMNVHDRSVAEILGRAGFSTTDGLGGKYRDPDLAALQGADLDFGRFNRARGFGISRGTSRSPIDNRTLGRRLSQLTDKIGDSVSSFTNFDLRMSDIHNALARIVPLLIVFIGTIPAAATALITLAGAALGAAAAFASIMGLGALGMGMEDGEFSMDNLSEAWSDIRDAFLEAFAPLAERLQPLFEDALDGIELFFQAVANQGDALMSLTDELRAFGGFLLDFIPQALRTVAGMVEALAPVFGSFGSWLQNNFAEILRTMVGLTMEIVPVLATLGKLIADILPILTKLSIGFMIVTNVLLKFFGAISKLLSFLGLTTEQTGLLIGGLLAFVSVVLLARSALISFAISGVWTAMKALWQFYLASWNSTQALAVFSGTALAGAVQSLIRFTAGVFKSIAGLVGFSISAINAAKAAAAFWTAVTLGGAIFLVGIVADIASSFMGLEENIRGATDAMKEFDRVSGRSGGGVNPYGGESPQGTRFQGGGGTTINIESTGDRQQDKTTGKYAHWRQGRTSGGKP